MIVKATSLLATVPLLRRMKVRTSNRSFRHASRETDEYASSAAFVEYAISGETSTGRFPG